MLTGVTITGADDRVDPFDLAKLSREYPFVEWGILVSESRSGTSRYPSRKWMVELEDTAERFVRTGDPSAAPMRLSAHFCGAVAREAMAGRLHPLPVIERMQRIQVNGYQGRCPGVVEFGQRMPCYEIILQARAEDDLANACQDAIEIGHASILFDPSGGKGRSVERWAMPPCSGTDRQVPMGYAGGLGPWNVRNEVARITRDSGMFQGDYWIDMESGVRSEYRGDEPVEEFFDLERVREVLRSVQSMVWPGDRVVRS